MSTMMGKPTASRTFTPDIDEISRLDCLGGLDSKGLGEERSVIDGWDEWEQTMRAGQYHPSDKTVGELRRREEGYHSMLSQSSVYPPHTNPECDQCPGLDPGWHICRETGRLIQ